LSSASNVCIHIIFVVVFASVLYSASVFDLETVNCLCALHDTRFDPSKIANLLVDRLSSKQSAQSASANPLITINDDLVMRSPRSMVPLTYRSIRFTAV
jgi:hypothetical protein